MLTPRLTHCEDCNDILEIISEIDCKIGELSNNLLNNIVYMLNLPYCKDVVLQLLMYKRILQYKYCNSNYACEFTTNQIINKVKKLLLQ